MTRLVPSGPTYYFPPLLLSHAPTFLRSYFPPLLLSSALTFFRSYFPFVDSCIPRLVDSFSRSRCPLASAAWPPPHCWSPRPLANPPTSMNPTARPSTSGSVVDPSSTAPVPRRGRRTCSSAAIRSCSSETSAPLSSKRRVLSTQRGKSSLPGSSTRTPTATPLARPDSTTSSPWASPRLRLVRMAADPRSSTHPPSSTR